MEISRKIVLVGSFGVGKTSLISRYVHQKFSDNYLTTIGVKIEKKPVKLNDQQINLIIWDIAGESTAQKVSTNYLKGAHGFIYVFDVSREESYVNMDSDLFELAKVVPDAPIEVIGNKMDLVSEEKLKEISNSNQRAIRFTSAKTGDHVEKVFENIALESL